MTMERRRVKLRQHVDLIHSRVDAVTDGNIHQAVFAREWNGWLAALFR